jgi:large subunit ribosomal protein L3
MKAKKIGIIGKKLGMTQLYHNEALIGVTVVDFSDMKVIGHRTPEKDGYSAVILGYDFKTVRRVKIKDGKETVKEFEKPKIIREIRTDDVSSYENDEKLGEALNSIVKVDVSGIMKGRGFAGVMKRWGFSGGPATHGSKTHRRPGSLGQCTSPAKVFKGKKMPGHYGNTKVTTLSQKLVRVDMDRRVLFVKGAIPGSKNGIVMVRDAVKA